MDALHSFAGSFLLAMVRYLPATALTSLTPLRWAPPMVRIVLAMVLAWLTVQAQPAQVTFPQGGAIGWVGALAGELMLGLAFGLAVMLPQAALHMGGWLIDIQAGASAAVLFNPAAQGETQSLLGTLLMLVGTVLFSPSTCTWTCTACWSPARTCCRWGRAGGCIRTDCSACWAAASCSVWSSWHRWCWRCWRWISARRTPPVPCRRPMCTSSRCR
jgi:hypothetical protein